MKEERIYIRISKEDKERIKEKAKKENWTITKWIYEAIKKAMKNNQKTV